VALLLDAGVSGIAEECGALVFLYGVVGPGGEFHCGGAGGDGRRLRICILLVSLGLLLLGFLHAILAFFMAVEALVDGVVGLLPGVDGVLDLFDGGGGEVTTSTVVLALLKEHVNGLFGSDMSFIFQWEGRA